MYEALGSHSPIAAAVRDLRTKKGRREQGNYAVEGPTLLAEALESGVQPRSVFGTAEALGQAAGLLARAGCPVYQVGEAALRKMSDLTTAPGLIAVLPLPRFDLERALGGAAALLLAGLNDPGNAGTLVRTAEIFGLGGVIFTPDAVEPFNPKVVRAAMGALFRMSVAVAPAAEAVRTARARGFRIVASGHGGTPLPGYIFAERSLVAIGNERRGVAPQLADPDDTVSIPQPGRGESLNAAVAGGILLYALSLAPKTPLSSLGGHFGA